MVSPNVTFTIPSLQDQIELECRIYRPTTALGHSTEPRSTVLHGAILAHPYANLGGSFDDPAVLTVAQALLRQGYVVGTFNFRGAGLSKGSMSWSGLPELADYVSFVGFFTSFLDSLSSGKQKALDTSLGERETISSSSSAVATATAEGDNDDDDGDDQFRRRRISLVLGGYSYGSRILTHLPSVSSIVQRFVEGGPGSIEAIIVETAACIAAKELAEGKGSGNHQSRVINEEVLSPQLSSHSVHMGGSVEPTTSKQKRHSRHRLGSPKHLGSSFRKSLDVIKGKRKSGIGSDQDKEGDNDLDADMYGSSLDQPQDLKAPHALIDLRFLLVSPVLPPLGWLTSPRLVRPSPRSEGSPSSSMEVAGRHMDVVDEWWSYPSLVVYGEGDQFTSVKRLRHWTDTLKSEDGLVSKVQSREIKRQDHFWYTSQSEEHLNKAITDWLVQNPTGDGLK